MLFSRTLLLKFSISILSLLLCELFLRGLLYFTLLNQVTMVIESDEEYFWKQRSNLDLVFEGAAVKTDDQGRRIPTKINPDLQSNLRIYVMGASPSFGWGVEEESTYSGLLRLKLEGAKVVNASQIGYSSHQGLKLLKNNILVHDDPTHVILSYLINDLDYYRFYFDLNQPDHLVESFPVSSIQRMLASTGFYQAAMMMVGQLRRGRELERHVPRVPVEQYEENLKQAIELLQQKDISVLLLSMPVNVQAETPLGKKGKSWRSSAVQRIQEARLDYYKVQKKLARIYDIPLIDVNQAFEAEDRYLFLDPERDTIHPNELGHSIIAKLLAAHFIDKYQALNQE